MPARPMTDVEQCQGKSNGSENTPWLLQLLHPEACICWRVGQKNAGEKHRRCGQGPGKTRLFATRNYLSTEPPWRVLFFGTDDFAVESLKLLSASRYDTHNNLHASEQRGESLQWVTLTWSHIVLSHKSWSNSPNRSGTRLE